MTPSVQVSFTDPTQNIERTLLISGDVVVGAVVKGAWAGVGRLHELVLERVPLSRAQIDVFRRTGEVPEAPSLKPADDPIVCECMRVPRSALVGAMQRRLPDGAGAFGAHRRRHGLRRLSAAARRADCRGALANGALASR